MQYSFRWNSFTLNSFWNGQFVWKINENRLEICAITSMRLGAEQSTESCLSSIFPAYSIISICWSTEISNKFILFCTLNGAHGTRQLKNKNHNISTDRLQISIFFHNYFLFLAAERQRNRKASNIWLGFWRLASCPMHEMSFWCFDIGYQFHSHQMRNEWIFILIWDLWNDSNTNFVLIFKCILSMNSG